MWKRIFIYINIQLNHFAIHLKLTQHCKSAVLQLKERKREQEKEVKVYIVFKATKSKLGGKEGEE